MLATTLPPNGYRRSRLLIASTIGLVLVAAIWVGSLTDRRGMVSPDSDSYLRQAAFFVEGRGIHSRGGVEPEPFTTWPLGYPLAIAVAARLTGLSVFWAAKVVNTTAALICIVLLLRALPRTGGTASLALLSGGSITAFSRTLSEGLFTLALLVAALAIARLLERRNASAAVILGAAVAAAFGIRYIGILLLMPVLAVCLWSAAQRRRRTARLLAGSLVGAALPIGAYLWLNHVVSGSLLPGAPERQERLPLFALDAARALAAEANFAFAEYPDTPLLWAVFAAVMVLTLVVVYQVTIRRRDAAEVLPDRQERLTIVVLAVAGVFFWTCMVAMGSYRQFDPLSYRLLAPGTVLVTAAAFGVLATRGCMEHARMRTAAALVVLASVVHSCVYQPLVLYRDQQILFTERMQDVLAHYADVPAGAVVLHASRHLLFLRPDLRVVPDRRMGSNETLFVDQARRAGLLVWSDEGGRLRLVAHE